MSEYCVKARPRRTMWVLRIGLPLLTLLAVPAAAQPTPSAHSSPSPTIFRFTTDGFWTNLHHFLYVLGRDQAEASDRHRDAVKNAPAEQTQGLARMADGEAEVWRAAVDYYAGGPSSLDTVFDEELYQASGAMVRLDGDQAAETLADEEDLGGSFGEEWREALDRVAPVYRRVFWDAHRQSNERWVSQLEPLVGQYGPAVLARLTRAYGLPWPREGYPVQVARYSNWAGAYSTHGRLLVVASNEERLDGNLDSLEITFHEAMHQWDDATQEMLIAAAIAEGVRFPGGLSHAMLFFTVGEAMRGVIPDHVPYAVKYGIWQRRSGVFLPILEEVWRPYVAGVLPREEALSRLMRSFR